MTVVERVARAICAAIATAPEYLDGEYPYQSVARAAIEAMREPFHDLTPIGYDAAKEVNSHGLLLIQLEAATDAMIDAALRET